MRDYHATFEHGQYYHIYNRGNNKEIIFREERNYDFFLGKWTKYLAPYTETWAYCLIPNHFHLLIRIPESKDYAKQLDINNFLENQFKKFLSSYTLSFNKVYNRSGSLFQKRFKRVHIDSQNYLLALIHYIHHNPIHHGISRDYNKWKYSSYRATIGQDKTNIFREEILSLFGGRKAFLEFHEQLKTYKNIHHLIIEE